MPYGSSTNKEVRVKAADTKTPDTDQTQGADVTVSNQEQLEAALKNTATMLSLPHRSRI